MHDCIIPLPIATLHHQLRHPIWPTYCTYMCVCAYWKCYLLLAVFMKSISVGVGTGLQIFLMCAALWVPVIHTTYHTLFVGTSESLQFQVILSIPFIHFITGWSLSPKVSVQSSHPLLKATSSIHQEWNTLHICTYWPLTPHHWP